MKWFGEPWPSAEHRASVCEDEADEMPVPVGAPCPDCDRQIQRHDRGVQIGHLDEAGALSARCFHLRCFLVNVLGEKVADDVLGRMR